jgi:hypothetical protein
MARYYKKTLAAIIAMVSKANGAGQSQRPISKEPISNAKKYHYGCEIVTKNIRNDDTSEYSTMTSCQTLLLLPVRTQMTYLIYSTFARLPSA